MAFSAASLDIQMGLIAELMTHRLSIEEIADARPINSSTIGPAIHQLTLALINLQDRVNALADAAFAESMGAGITGLQQNLSALRTATQQASGVDSQREAPHTPMYPGAALENDLFAELPPPEYSLVDPFQQDAVPSELPPSYDAPSYRRAPPIPMRLNLSRRLAEAEDSGGAAPLTGFSSSVRAYIRHPADPSTAARVVSKRR